MQWFSNELAKLRAKQKQSFNKRRIKWLTKKIRTKHYKRVILTKQAKASKNKN